jgi:hypothetical protein
MTPVPCGWMGCRNDAESSLGARPLCRKHFYEIGMRRMDDYRAMSRAADLQDAERAAATSFLSDLIGQTTSLVTGSKTLTPVERELYLQLTLSAAELFRRVQRGPRIRVGIPIRIFREHGGAQDPEAGYTVNVSKQGACISLKRACLIGEEIWIQTLGHADRARSRVTWMKQTKASEFVLGLKILEPPDFWDSTISRSPGSASAAG